MASAQSVSKAPRTAPAGPRPDHAPPLPSPRLSALREWSRGALALLAALVPACAALTLAAASPQWRDDAALVRTLGLSVAPGAGAVSTLLGMALQLVPLGNATFRVSMVAALGAAAAAYQLFRLTERLLDHARPSVMNPLVALVAALTAALSPALLRESTTGGGAVVAVALALGALRVWSPGSAGSLRSWAWLGALWGLTLAESAVAAVVLGAALVAQGLSLRARSGERALAVGFAGLLGAAALVALPALLRPLAPASWTGLGLAHGFGDLRALDVVSLRGRGIGAWIADVGLGAFALSCLGAASGLLRPSLRWAAAPLLVPLAFDVLAPATSSGALSLDPLAPLRALAVGTAAAAAALGVQSAALWLRASSLPLARPAAALLVAFQAAVGAVAAEEGFRRADRGRNAGAEAWTDRALERLPPSSLVLVRSEPLTWRLWAARMSAGMRPDVTVVPLPLLGRGRLASALLREEPSLVPLLRDVSSSGSPSEFGLSSVADVRPLFVEMAPPWDRSLASHATSEGLWLRFAPQPCGMSDRRATLGPATSAFYTVVGAARRDEPHDEATLEVLASHARELAVVGALTSDRELSHHALLHLSALHREPAPDDPIWDVLDPSRKIDPKKRGPRARR